METFYLIDFENVHNEGLSNINLLSENDHVHIFYTENASKIEIDIDYLKRIEKAHKVPAGNQSLDKHLVSYLGYLLGSHGKQCSCVIVSTDKGYDKIRDFWMEQGYPNIVRKQAIPSSTKQQKKAETQQTQATVQTTNSKISAGMAYDFSGNDRSELNVFMQHGLIAMGYKSSDANRICKDVIAHCNDERMLSGIHNDLRNDFNEYSEVYEDVKTILREFVSSKSKGAKRELQVRSFFEQHFKAKIYVDRKEDIIHIILNAKTRQQVNNGLMKLYLDGRVVKQIYQTIQPLMKDLPGK